VERDTLISATQAKEFGVIDEVVVEGGGRAEDPRWTWAPASSRLKEEYRAIAERRVRLGLILSDIGQKNALKVARAQSCDHGPGAPVSRAGAEGLGLLPE